MQLFVAILLSLLADAPRPFTSPASARPEFGHGLTPGDAAAGWVSMYDGKTSFGWANGSVSGGSLTAGMTNTVLGDYEVRVEAGAPGRIFVGKHRKPMLLGAGESALRVEGAGVGPIELGPGTALRKLLVRPLRMQALNETSRWRVIERPSRPGGRGANWQLNQSRPLVRVTGGPGAAQLPGRYGDFVLQVAARCNRPLANAGVFVRCMEGEYLDGYEAQIFNGCYDRDPARPARYATGAIDDRQNARRLVSRDGETFVLTIVATGPHLATWVNGVQVTDWTDTRKEDDNPRRGRRTKAGPIQLQAHDNDTDVEFHDLRIVPLDASP